MGTIPELSNRLHFVPTRALYTPLSFLRDLLNKGKAFTTAKTDVAAFDVFIRSYDRGSSSDRFEPLPTIDVKVPSSEAASLLARAAAKCVSDLHEQSVHPTCATHVLPC